MARITETLEGYIVDIACLRRYPRTAWAEKARSHTKRCSLEGHCLESGFGLVGEDGRVALLESGATPKVVSLLDRSARDHGIRAQVVREQHGGNMVTVSVEEVAPPRTGTERAAS